MRYLLDTNIISDLIIDPEGRVMQKVRKAGEARICTSIIVAAELRYGASKRASARLTTIIETILNRMDILPFESPADIVYGDVRTELEKSGLQIGANDLLIGAHALALGHTMITDNEREFARIKGLRVENWRRQR